MSLDALLRIGAGTRTRDGGGHDPTDRQLAHVDRAVSVVRVQLREPGGRERALGRLQHDALARIDVHRGRAVLRMQLARSRQHRQGEAEEDREQPLRVRTHERN